MNIKKVAERRKRNRMEVELKATVRYQGVDVTGIARNMGRGSVFIELKAGAHLMSGYTLLAPGASFMGRRDHWLI